MAYADLTYYKTTYGGKSLVDAETTKWIDRASDDIDHMTNHSIVESDLTTWQIGMVKKANCAQAEYYVINGDAYNSEAMQSAGIGKFSYSSGGAQKKTLSSRAMNYLVDAGLMFAGVDVAGSYYAG